MFEKATRLKIRFNYKGVLTVEDLWDLSVEDLDSIFKSLNAKLKVANEESLLTTRSKEDTIISLQVEIIKHIVTVKLEEAKKRLEAKERREKKAKILEKLAEKQDKSLDEKSEDELKKMLEELD